MDLLSKNLKETSVRSCQDDKLKFFCRCENSAQERESQENGGLFHRGAAVVCEDYLGDKVFFGVVPQPR